MKIVSFRIYQYVLDFNQPVIVNGQSLTQREGFIIRLKSDQGVEGYGEAAPLAGVSKENLADALDQIQLLKSKLNGNAVPDGLTRFDGLFDRWFDIYELKPSVRFAIESTLLQLIANSEQKPLYRILPQFSGSKVNVSGLLSGSVFQVKNEAKRLVDEGYTDLKLKVGGDVQEDIEKVAVINEATLGKALLHLDANQMWDFGRAVDFAQTIGCSAVTYIEEPFKNYMKIPEFFDRTMIPVALDESLQRLSVEEIRTISGVETLVIKPTILGGVEKVLNLISEAKACALNTVISSAFETSIGISTLAHLAEASAHHSAAGIDTLKWFKSDVVKSPFPVEHGCVNLDQPLIKPENIRFDLMSEI